VTDPVFFYLGIGTQRPRWLEQVDVPFFVARINLQPQYLGRDKTLPRAINRWALDSGGFTQVHKGGWELTVPEYVAEVRRYVDEIGKMDWCAPMDWMCEETALAATGLTVREHQKLTTENFLELRQELGETVIPVLQGWERDDYLQHVEDYEKAGVYLEDEERVGVGSICRRHADGAIGSVLQSLQPLRLHAFGVKGTALARYHNWITSADSMAWSATARFGNIKLFDCTHGGLCSKCPEYALQWREKTLERVYRQKAQGKLFEDAFTPLLVS
tara:strand:- start:415 stop:1233 length:819 start_codon:yes stop_codon:yes gene_type:complete